MMEDLSQLTEGQLVALIGTEPHGPKKDALVAELAKRTLK